MSATYEEIEIAFDNGELDTTFPPSVYEAYCDVMELDIDDLTGDYREASRNIGDNYIGHYDSYEAFITDYILGSNEIDPNEGALNYLVIDYQKSWEANYRHEFYFSGTEYSGEGHYFHQF